MNAARSKKPAPPEPTRPAGRPIIGRERKLRYNVMLEPALAEQLRELGGGNLSAGIERALASLTPPATAR